jgi:hypothetical protein
MDSATFKTFRAKTHIPLKMRFAGLKVGADSNYK